MTVEVDNATKSVEELFALSDSTKSEVAVFFEAELIPGITPILDKYCGKIANHLLASAVLAFKVIERSGRTSVHCEIEVTSDIYKVIMLTNYPLLPKLEVCIQEMWDKGEVAVKTRTEHFQTIIRAQFNLGWG